MRDWAQVHVVPAPPIDAIYANPSFGMLYTAGSNAGDELFSAPWRLFRRSGAPRAAGQCGGGSGACPSQKNSPPNPASLSTPNPAAGSAMARSPKFAQIPGKCPGDQNRKS